MPCAKSPLSTRLTVENQTNIPKLKNFAQELRVLESREQDNWIFVFSFQSKILY